MCAFLSPHPRPFGAGRTTEVNCDSPTRRLKHPQGCCGTPRGVITLSVLTATGEGVQPRQDVGSQQTELDDDTSESRDR